MKVTKTILPGVLIIEPKVFFDERGFFLESFRDAFCKEIGINIPFVQDNHSRSTRGVLRGLHMQVEHPQGKLVRASFGAVFDVAVDINPLSPTFGKYVGVELNDTNHRQMYIPPGYAHGFCVLSETADFQYKCTDYYFGNDQGGVLWNDPAIGIDWPIKDPILSDRDKSWPTLAGLAGHKG